MTKIFYIIFIYSILTINSFSKEFIGVIGVAVGEINNQKKVIGHQVIQNGMVT